MTKRRDKVADVGVWATVKNGGRVTHKRGYETFLFRRAADGWKAIHAHSPTRPVR